MLAMALYIEEMPRLQATETLAMSQGVALGQGEMKKGQRSKLIRHLERAAQPRKKRVPTHRERLMSIAAAGIAIERE